MSYLEDILVNPPQNAFCYLKELGISNCESLAYLFTISIANGLKKLEKLIITSCSALQYVVNGENTEAVMVTFHKLKFLSLCNLPKLVSLCDGHVNVTELPQLMQLDLDGLPNNSSIFAKNNTNISSGQPFFNKEVLIPKLEKLTIFSMENLKEIWECEITISEGEINNNISMLREISIHSCNSVVNLFPNNPMRLLTHLEELSVIGCGSIEVLFNIELGQIQQHSRCSLRNIHVLECESLREVWRIKGAEDNYFISGFQDVETIVIVVCERFRNIVTPTNVNFDMKALKDIRIGACDEYGERNNELFKNSQEQEVSQVDVVSWSLCLYSTQIDIYQCDALSSVIPYYAAGQTLKLQVLSISGCASMMEVFESKDITSNNISGCSSNTIVAIPRPTYRTVHKLPNLKKLDISDCDCLENIFTFSTLESLKKLEELTIRKCDAMKVIVREEVQEDTTTLFKKVVFTSLKSIKLDGLPNLSGFFLGMNIDFEWPLLEYVKIEDCPQMTVFTSGQSTTPRLKYINTGQGQHDLECGLNFHQTPSTSLDCISSNPTKSEGRTWSFDNLIQCNLGYAHEDTKIFPSSELQKLEKLETIHAQDCKKVEVVFEVASNVVKIPKLREVDLKWLRSLKYIWKSNQWRKLEFPNLTRLSISKCDSLEYVFTCSMVCCVKQLQELHIQRCEKMKGVVKVEEDCGDKVSEIIEFPRLKSLNLDDLESLEGFSLGKGDFTFPSLDTLQITVCPKIMVFTDGRSIIPEQTAVETSFGSFNVGEDINSFLMTKKQEGFNFGRMMENQY